MEVLDLSFFVGDVILGAGLGVFCPGPQPQEEAFCFLLFL